MAIAIIKDSGTMIIFVLQRRQGIVEEVCTSMCDVYLYE
jgi:hypothetical protein